MKVRAYHLEIDEIYNLTDETLRAHECRILQAPVMFMRENLVDGKGRFEFTLAVLKATQSNTIKEAETTRAVEPAKA